MHVNRNAIRNVIAGFVEEDVAAGSWKQPTCVCEEKARSVRQLGLAGKRPNSNRIEKQSYDHCPAYQLPDVSVGFELNAAIALCGSTVRSLR